MYQMINGPFQDQLKISTHRPTSNPTIQLQRTKDKQMAISVQTAW